MNRQRGMTLVELMVSLAIVLLIIGAATAAYLKLLRTYKTQGALSESYMANLTGLELVRYDIEMAGFGLPASLAAGVTYNEAVAKSTYPYSPDTYVPSYDPSALNDSGNVPDGPRAFVQLDNLGPNGSDVLAIKSSVANINPVSKKWSMITNVNGDDPQVKLWGGAALDTDVDFTTNDNFILLNSDGMLLPSTPGVWPGPYTFNASAPNTGYYADASGVTGSENTPSNAQVYYMYGLDNSPLGHRMPFNRVDYYLDKDTDFPAPSSCAPGTYTLFRSTIDQQNGKLDPSPLVDCVEDFQVAFGIDPSGNGTQAIQWQNNLNGMTSAQIQKQLREVRLFVLRQEGIGDTSKSPGFRFSGTLNLGDQDTGQLSSFTPTGNKTQYRWKITEIAVKPMNLLNLPNGTMR